MSIVIRHNHAGCTSHNVLEVIRTSEVEPNMIDYLADGWTRPQPVALFVVHVSL